MSEEDNKTKGYIDISAPSFRVLIALGSIIVHYEELLSNTGHPADQVAIDFLRDQSDVKEWFDKMNQFAFLPVKR